MLPRVLTITIALYTLSGLENLTKAETPIIFNDKIEHSKANKVIEEKLKKLKVYAIPNGWIEKGANCEPFHRSFFGIIRNGETAFSVAQSCKAKDPNSKVKKVHIEVSGLIKETYELEISEISVLIPTD